MTITPKEEKTREREILEDNLIQKTTADLVEKTEVRLQVVVHLVEDKEALQDTARGHKEATTTDQAQDSEGANLPFKVQDTNHIILCTKSYKLLIYLKLWMKK